MDQAQRPGADGSSGARSVAQSAEVGPGASTVGGESSTGQAVPVPTSTQGAADRGGPERGVARVSAGELVLVIDDHGRRVTRSYRVDLSAQTGVLRSHRLGVPGVQETGPVSFSIGAAGGDAAARRSFDQDLGRFAAPMLESVFGAQRIGLGEQVVPGRGAAPALSCTEWARSTAGSTLRTRRFEGGSSTPVAVVTYTGDGAEDVEILAVDGTKQVGDLVVPLRLNSTAGLEFELVEFAVGGAEPGDSR